MELMNRQSALGSYIFCLCEIFQKNRLDVVVNGIPFDELKRLTPDKSPESSSQSGILKKILPKSIKDLLKDFLVFKHMKQLFQQVVAAGSYDYVLEFYNYASDVGYNISRQQNIPLILVYDSPVLEEHIFFNGNKLFFKKEILKRQLKTLMQAKHIVAYSRAVESYLNKLTSKKLSVSIHQNVDYTRFDFLEKKFTGSPIKIGFIGSFLKWHRIDLLLLAFDRLKRENYNVELFLVGFGMEFNAIKLLTDKSPYNKHITITGFMDGASLVEMKKQLHIGVMPGSNWYGAPNKIFEYGAAQMAVIAPNTPTISDLFQDEKEVLLFKQDDADALYQKLKVLCSDLTLAEELARTLQKKIRNNYNERITFEFYNKLLS
jgi:glycosyltransferase involved in cell wall biosynthesis